MLVLTRHATEYSPAKTEEYLSDIPQFSEPSVLRKIMVINTIASIWRENMLGYLSRLDIICSLKVTVLFELRSRKTVLFSEQIMSADKYPSIISRQMEAVVYLSQLLVCRISYNLVRLSGEKIIKLMLPLI